jgi:ABC-type sugar transport system ATPase subunit
MSVRENISIVLLPRLCKAGIVDTKRQKAIVDEYIKKLGIKTPDANQLVKYLSGGNQQKVILARWLCSQPEFLILDEPTRGIDVGAKSEIEKLILEFSENGISVLMISSETDEIIRNADRVCVMRDGCVAGTLEGDKIAESEIMQYMADA